MSDPKYCPNCGAELGPDAPEALCPKCLMENAAWSQTELLPDDLAAAPTMLDPCGPPKPGPSRDLPSVGADFGGYRIMRLLGKGGMGAVYEAEQVENGRRVALKVLSHKLDSNEARKRFIREGRLAASINHPNSVYVFGTEEIEGTPAISMEIVPGGTLQEKVSREGPMSVPQAVDSILQIVSGLQSAQAIGILHRDVKPSNCFIDDHGVAKIGDFGLSISTEGRGDSHLTIQGSLLGTPAFSSPEQLRGDELNARSDMYSVGATLFYLLTGRAPFEEANMVKLLSRVLEEKAPDPRSLRSDLPKSLARIILRCLCKTPTDRFKSYADLCQALRPYSSESPTPATLALRFGAHLIDTIILGMAGFVIQAVVWGNVGDIFNQSNFGTAKHSLLLLGLTLMMGLYYGILEGLRGASLGKNLLRLRLVGPDGTLPGFRRAFFRAMVLQIILAAPYWTATVLDASWMSQEQGVFLSILVGLANILTIGILFCAARRRNGFAGLHGLATGTRVVRAPAMAKRPALTLIESPPRDPLEGAERIGPYHVIEPLGPAAPERWFLCYDTRLLRQVWVHVVEPGTPEIRPIERNLNRPGRVRWITGRRTDRENWDAYEALAGKPLQVALGEPQSWAAVRFWLLDLAEEFASAQADETTPSVLSFDRGWLTEDGHAKLLDFPAPGSAAGDVNYEDPSSFLRAVAETTLRSSTPPVPLHVRAALAPGLPVGLGNLLEMLRLSVRRPASISRLRRWSISLGVSIIPLLGLLFTALFIALNHQIQKSNPELMDLGSVTLAIQMEQDEKRREDLRRFVAGQFRDLIEDPATWRKWESNIVLDPRRQRIAKEAVAKYPQVSGEDLERAQMAAKWPLEQNLGVIPALPPIAPLAIVLTFWIAYSAIPALLMALLMRRGLILMIFGAVVVNANGEQASRLRTVWRGMITWSPFLLGAILAALLVPPLGAIAATAVVLTLIVILSVISHLRVDRSLQDRLARTWLVPK